MRENLNSFCKVILILIAAPFVIGTWMIFNPRKVWQQAIKEWFS